MPSPAGPATDVLVAPTGRLVARMSAAANLRTDVSLECRPRMTFRGPSASGCQPWPTFGDSIGGRLSRDDTRSGDSAFPTATTERALPARPTRASLVAAPPPGSRGHGRPASASDARQTGQAAAQHGSVGRDVQNILEATDGSVAARGVCRFGIARSLERQGESIGAYHSAASPRRTVRTSPSRRVHQQGEARSRHG